jgi:hypothetical protein
MAGLPHFDNSQASRNLYEPVHQNLFEVTFLPPTGVAGSPILLEHVNTVSGLEGINPAVEAVGQKYKFADRSFAGMPSQTFIDVTVVFSLNLNDANQMYAYKTLRQWKDKIFDPLTGAMGLKKDYVGTLIIVEYNRKGNIYRKLTLKDTFITGQLTGLDGHDYNTAEPLTITAVFRTDHWDEELT